ncbi:MAG TPA: hypothetical protein VGH28_20195 [Polyangiaceae bacterium]|jgi:hypothetical protein
MTSPQLWRTSLCAPRSGEGDAKKNGAGELRRRRLKLNRSLEEAGPMRPPTFTPAEELIIRELEEETVTQLELRAECSYDTNLDLGTSLRDEVWEEFVRRANDAGYRAERRGAVVAVKNPGGNS